MVPLFPRGVKRVRLEVLTRPRRNERLRAGSVNVNLHGLAYAQEKRAWILYAPLHIGNSEVSVGDPMVRENLQANGHREFVVGAMDGKNSMDLHGGCAGIRDF